MEKDPAAARRKSSIITGTFIVLAAWKLLSAFRKSVSPPARSVWAGPPCAPGSAAIRALTFATRESWLVCSASNVAATRAITCKFPASRPAGRADRRIPGLVDLGPDALVVLVAQHEGADDKRDQRDDDRKRE